MSAVDILDAIEDAERMWPHNAHVMHDEAVGTAVQAALGRQTVDEEMGDAFLITPRLIPADARYSAMTLHEAVFEDTPPARAAARCDRCYADAHVISHLWVSAGASVVDVQCCVACMVELDAAYSPRWK